MPSLEDLKPGLKYSMSVEVDPSLTVPHLPHALPNLSDMPAVFATAYMVAFVEATCIEATKPYFGDLRSVGTGIDMTHTAATPIGFKVTAEVELVEVKGRALRFKVEARDDKEVIGAGFHDRYIIDVPKFNARVEAKAKAGAA